MPTSKPFLEESVMVNIMNVVVIGSTMMSVQPRDLGQVSRLLFGWGLRQLDCKAAVYMIDLYISDALWTL